MILFLKLFIILYLLIGAAFFYIFLQAPAEEKKQRGWLGIAIALSALWWVILILLYHESKKQNDAIEEMIREEESK